METKFEVEEKRKRRERKRRKKAPRGKDNSSDRSN